MKSRILTESCHPLFQTGFFPGIYQHLVGRLFCHLCTHDEIGYWQLDHGSKLIIVSLSI